jgi:hypothetical protein
MVTKEALAQLRAQRAKPTPTMNYTIGGSVQIMVHATVEGERLRHIQYGEQRLQNALAELRQNQALRFRQGLAQSQFNFANTVKP